MTANLVEQLIERVAKQRKCIVVIGDAIVDEWVHGRVEACQDGCPKFVEESRHTSPGGADNARNCLSEWGVDADLFAQAKQDYPIKYRFVNADGNIVFRWDSERKAPEFVPSWVRDRSLEMVKFAGAVLLSDYDKGVLSPGFVREVIDLCNARGIPCVADAKRGQSLYKGAVIKANTAWGVAEWKGPLDVYNSDGEVVGQDTRGCAGAYVETHSSYDPGVWVDGGFIPLEVSDWPPVKCVNHVGAGDCFAAHLTLAIAYGFSLCDAAALAHSAGRVYVQHSHNRPPRPQEIANDLALVSPLTKE